MLTLNHLHTYFGPSPFAQTPVILMSLRVSEVDLNELLQAKDKLAEMTSDWYVSPDSDVKKSGHEQLAIFISSWTLQALVFVRGYLLANGYSHSEKSDVMQIWVGFHEPSLSIRAINLACESINALASDKTCTSWRKKLDQFWLITRRLHPDYQARILMEAACFMDVPYAPGWGLQRYWRFGQGEKSTIMFESSSQGDGYLAASVAGCKITSKLVMRSLGLPVPDSILIEREEQVAKAVEKIGFPCVVKPSDRGGGKGVTAGLVDIDSVISAFNNAKSYTKKPVILETFLSGDDHRLVVIDGELVAVIRREPPSVIGDGIHTVFELIQIKNHGRHPLSLSTSNYQRPIIIDDGLRLKLHSEGVRLNEVLETDRKLRVRGNANLSTGGDCVDVTSAVHPAVRLMAEALAKTLNLKVMGADYLTEDISKNDGAFIEINTTPGLDILIAAGWSAADTGKLFLGSHIGRIKTELIIARKLDLPIIINMLKHLNLDYSTFDELNLKGVSLCVDQTHPWASVGTLMSHSLVNRAIILVEDQQIYDHGFPIDKVDRAMLCNVNLSSSWNKVLDSLATELLLFSDIDDFSDFINTKQNL